MCIQAFELFVMNLLMIKVELVAFATVSCTPYLEVKAGTDCDAPIA
jgi:hypothetical protein